MQDKKRTKKINIVDIDLKGFQRVCIVVVVACWDMAIATYRIHRSAYDNFLFLFYVFFFIFGEHDSECVFSRFKGSGSWKRHHHSLIQHQQHIVRPSESTRYFDFESSAFNQRQVLARKFRKGRGSRHAWTIFKSY